MFNRKTNKIDLAIDKIISVQQQQPREKKMARKRPQPYSVLTERAAAKRNRNTKKTLKIMEFYTFRFVVLAILKSISTDSKIKKNQPICTWTECWYMDFRYVFRK